MKNRLIAQTTEYDCGPTSVTNALRFLFEREELPARLPGRIWALMNDIPAEAGGNCSGGTSRAVMRYTAEWLNACGSCGLLPIAAETLTGEDAVLQPGSRAWEALSAGACAVLRCWSGAVEHYVLLTGIEPDGVAVFDPYDEDPDYACSVPRIRVVTDAPKRMNRVVDPAVFAETLVCDYAPVAPAELQVFRRREASACPGQADRT